MADDYLFQGDGDDEFGSLAPARGRNNGGGGASPDGPSAYVFLFLFRASPPAPLRARAARAAWPDTKTARGCGRAGGCGRCHLEDAPPPVVSCGQKPLRCADAPPTDRATHVSARSRRAPPVASRVSLRAPRMLQWRGCHTRRAPFLPLPALMTAAATTKRPPRRRLSTRAMRSTQVRLHSLQSADGLRLCAHCAASDRAFQPPSTTARYFIIKRHAMSPCLCGACFVLTCVCHASPCDRATQLEPPEHRHQHQQRRVGHAAAQRKETGRRIRLRRRGAFSRAALLLDSHL